MQSSTTVLCRALVMLTCLVVVPLVTLFGKSLPQMVGSFLDRRVDPDTTAANQSLAAAPPFAADDASVGTTTTPTSLDSPQVILPNGGSTAHLRPGATLAGPPNPGPSVPPFAPQGTPTRPVGGMVPVGYNGPAGPVAPAAPARLSDSMDQQSTGVVRAGAADALGAVAGRPVPLVPVTSFPGGASPAEASQSTAGAFLGIQQRLRSLGAAYYRLESWGSQQPLFRFQCEMTLDGSPHLTRHFEATDGDPLRAMGKVLAEVESWKAVR